MARSKDAVLSLTLYSLIVVGLAVVSGFIRDVVGEFVPAQVSMVPVVSAVSAGEAVAVPEKLLARSVEVAKPTVAAAVVPVAVAGPSLSPRMQGALEYVTRRYRVSEDQERVGARTLGFRKPVADINQHRRHHRRLNHTKGKANRHQHRNIADEPGRRRAESP